MTIDLEHNSNADIVRIFFIRHGQTDHNVKKIIQGHHDIDINDNGVQQAKTLGKFIEKVKFDKMFSSDLVRCVNTSKEILEFQDCDFVTSQNWRERCMGKSEGLHIQDAIAKYGEDFRNLGEKHHELVGRLVEAFDLVVAESIEKGYTNVAICSHGGSITAFFDYLYTHGFKLNGLTKSDLRVPFNTSVSVVDVAKYTKLGTIQMFGNTRHLGADYRVQDQRLR
ncbi:broad-specificity phosphatase [[Candida] jaroonii]|uniref:Broad-specificity phosphatase n=1 Tax=[Candida] jaroonii TaxID=467808 RepID=A0ACA9Y142_9ASCO|nr:broad-specificity phosphatase [[Candida] jaroonii]